MLKNPVALNPHNHRHLLLSETNDYEFASDLIFIPIVFKEMADAAREYPLLFRKDIDLPIVLTGLEEGINAYVGADKSWNAHYVPFILQAYPFALAPAPDKPGKFVIAVDTDADPLQRSGGQPLFDTHDKPMGLLKKRIDLLKYMKELEPATKRLVAVLRQNDILIDRAVHIKSASGDVTQVTGLQVVDEEKLNKLSGEEFLRLRATGALPLIYSHLLSMANLRQGVIAGKYPDLAARPAPQGDAVNPKKVDSDFDLSMFASDDGDFEISH